jgi:predicted dehydrogenase
MKTYRVAVVGVAHMHILDVVKGFIPLSDRVEWVGAADVTGPFTTQGTKPSTHRANMAELLKLCGLGAPWEDWRKLLDQKPDMVLVYCENVYHHEVARAALERGIHVVMEKPMAMTLAQALDIERAAAVGGAHVIINWPSTWNPAFRLAKELVDRGEVGKVFKLTYRNQASTGPFGYGQGLTDEEKGREWWHKSAAGGGAFLDYCCYGACMASWFMNKSPVSAYGLKANFASGFGDAEDYGAVLARYDDAVAILEGSWTTVASGIPSGPIVYGLEGTLVSGWGNTVAVYKDRYSDEPARRYEVKPLPADRDTLAKEVIGHFDQGRPLHPTLTMKVNMDAMKVLDAALRSAASGREEMTGSGVWTIGR